MSEIFLQDSVQPSRTKFVQNTMNIIPLRPVHHVFPFISLVESFSMYTPGTQGAQVQQYQRKKQ